MKNKFLILSAAMFFISSTLQAQVFSDEYAKDSYKLLDPKQPLAQLIDPVNTEWSDNNITTGISKLSAWQWANTILTKPKSMRDIQMKTLKDIFASTATI